MPNREQMDAIVEQLERLETKGLSVAELALATYSLDGEGFSESERRDVEMRVFEGESPDFWLDEVQPDMPNEEKPKLNLPDAAHYTGEWAKELHEEMREDYDAARAMKYFGRMIEAIAVPPDFSEYDRQLEQAARQVERRVVDKSNGPDR
jgi:hypothetical protein